MVQATLDGNVRRPGGSDPVGIGIARSAGTAGHHDNPPHPEQPRQAAVQLALAEVAAVGVVPQVKNPFTGQSTIFLYDSYPGGIGFSQKLCDMHNMLLEAASDLVKACPCEDGCPSCVGPAMEIGPRGKAHTLELVNGLLSVGTLER